MIRKNHAFERSNYFAVEDQDKFFAYMDIAGIKCWAHVSKPHKVAISADPATGGTFPVLIQRPNEEELEGFCIRNTIRKHLVWGDTAILVGVMSGNDDHVDGWACVITRQYEPESITLSEWIHKTLNKMELDASDFIN